jgi:hypothetical protein
MAGTEVDRVDLPLSVANGIGQDVTIGLYADSTGHPTGAAIASCTIPQEWISGAATTNIHGRSTALLDPWITTPPNLSLPTPANNNGDVGLATTNTAVAAIGGWNGSTFIANTYAAPLSTSTIGSWMAGPSYPTAAAEVAASVTPDGYLVGAGGLYGSSSFSPSVYSASFSAAGTIGAWSQQSALPVGLAAPALVAASNGYLYVVGGTGTNSVVATVYRASAKNGIVSNWTQLGAYPLALMLIGLVEIDGYLVGVGGFTGLTGVANVYAAQILDNGDLGSWMAWPSLPDVVSYPGVAIVNNSIVVVTQGNAWSLNVATSGPAKAWITQPAPPSTTRAQANLIALPQGVAVLGEYGYLGNYVGAVSTLSHIGVTLSAPLHATGLTNGATYHVVVSGVGGVAGVNDGQVALVSGSNGATANYSTNGGTSWTAYPATTSIPITAYVNTNSAGYPVGRLAHTLEDVSGGVPARHEWYLWQYNGLPVALGEYTANANGALGTRCFSTLSYTAQGVLTDVVVTD